MNTFDEVANHVEFKDVAEREGNNSYYCGIHGDESTPDLKVYKEGNWKCHSCGASGQDVIRYVAEREGLNDFEAAKKLANIHNLDLETGQLSKEEKQKRKERKKIRNIQEDVVTKASANLKEKHRELLKERRRWSEETIEDLSLGWMDSSLFKSLKQKHDDILEDAGIHFGMTGSEKGSFLIPHLKRNGKPYLITCRDPEPGNSSPKYIQSKSSDHVDNDIYYATGRDSDTIIITEGYPDAISAYQAGYDAVAAGCGSFEGNHRRLSNFAENYQRVFLILDKDETGRENLQKTGRRLSLNHEVLIHQWSEEVPEGYDLDDWTNDNGYNLQKLIENSENFLDAFKSYSPSSTDSTLVNERIVVRGKIKGQKQGMSIPSKIFGECQKCGQSREIDLEKNNDLERVILTKKNHSTVIEGLLEGQSGNTECIGDGNKHEFNYSVEEYLDKTWVKVQDLLEQTEQFNVNQNNTIPAYIAGDQLPNSKTVKIRGKLKVNKYNDQRILIGTEVETEEKSFQEIDFDKKDHKEYRKRWSREKAEKMIASDMVGRPNARTALQLTVHSPVVIPNLEGNRIRGSLRTLFFGDGGTYKSQQMKELIKEYRLGEYSTAETSSRAGLVYTVNTDKEIIEWGVLPLNDKGIVAIDGLNQLHQEEMKNLREVLEEQQVTVNMSVKGSAPARVRIIGAMNPPKEPMERYYPDALAKAITDTGTFSKGPDIRRWDLYTPFCEGDVSDSRIAKAESKEKPYTKQFYRKHVLWAWSLKPEDIRYSKDVKSALVKKTEYLMSNYKYGSIPIVSSAFKEKLLRITVSFAVLQHSVTENGCVKVESDHVKQAADFFERQVMNLGIQELRKQEEKEEVLHKEEAKEVIEELTLNELNILRAIHEGASSSEEIGEKLGVSGRTVKNHWSNLKPGNYNLIEVKSGQGARLRPRGVQFVSRVKIEEVIKKKENNEEIHEVHEYTNYRDTRPIDTTEKQENNEEACSSENHETMKNMKNQGTYSDGMPKNPLGKRIWNMLDHSQKVGKNFIVANIENDPELEFEKHEILDYIHNVDWIREDKKSETLQRKRTPEA